MIKFIFTALILTAFPAQAEKNCDIKRHALYDVGSGSTKLSVVETNSCEKIPKTLFNASEKVDYKDDLLKSKDSSFSDSIQKTGLEALKKLKAEAVKLNSTDHRGIATAAFRDAKNAAVLIEKIKKQHGIVIEVISQEQEGQLAYKAVRLYNADPEILVWDIGGGSFQLTKLDLAKNEWSVYKGDIASVGFKDLIIKKVKKNAELATPNPMTLDEVKKSRELVVKEMGPDLKKSFVARSKNKTVGIGGVLSQSVKNHLGKSTFTTQDIDLWIKQNHQKTDLQLNDKYAATAVSNMILVSEMMKLLKIKSVEAADIPLAQGLLEKAF